MARSLAQVRTVCLRRARCTSTRSNEAGDGAGTGGREAAVVARLTLNAGDRSAAVSVSISVTWDKRGIAGLTTGKLTAAAKPSPRADVMRDRRRRRVRLGRAQVLNVGVNAQ